jgi:hypothetical protein
VAAGRSEGRHPDLPARNARQGDATQEEYKHEVSTPTLVECREQIATLLGGAETPSFAAQAAALGQRLYHNLVPPDLRERLEQITTAVLLFLSEDDFPFELFHDGREFFGLRLAVGRRLVRRAGSGRGPRRRTSDRWKALVVASDPRGDLEKAQAEGTTVREHLSRFLEDTGNTSFLSGGQAAVDDLARRLAEGVDILHYCGHLEHRDDGTVGLLVADELILSAGEIANILSGSPFVFLNGCAGTRGPADRSPGLRQDDLASIVGAFVRGGARAVVGTLTDVSDRHAAVVSEEFYRLATTGIPIAESLRQARCHCRRLAPDSPSWLCFVLYGNPTERLLPAARGESPSTAATSWLAASMMGEIADAASLESRLRPDEYGECLAACRRLVETAVGDTPGGDLLGFVGGRFSARFRTASAAASAALRIQHQISMAGSSSVGWPPRIALHLDEIGELDPFGVSVPIVSRTTPGLCERALQAAPSWTGPPCRAASSRAHPPVSPRLRSSAWIRTGAVAGPWSVLFEGVTSRSTCSKSASKESAPALATRFRDGAPPDGERGDPRMEARCGGAGARRDHCA